MTVSHSALHTQISFTRKWEERRSTYKLSVYNMLLCYVERVSIFKAEPMYLQNIFIIFTQSLSRLGAYTILQMLSILFYFNKWLHQEEEDIYNYYILYVLQYIGKCNFPFAIDTHIVKCTWNVLNYLSTIFLRTGTIEWIFVRQRVHRILHMPLAIIVSFGSVSNALFRSLLP